MLDNIETWLVSIIPAATAVLSAIGVLIKVITAMKDSKSTTETSLKQIKGIFSVYNSMTTESLETVKNTQATIATYVSDAKNATSALEKKISEMESSYDEVLLTMRMYEDKLKSLEEQNIELQKKLIEVEQNGENQVL